MTEQLEFESAGSRERAMSSHGENVEALSYMYVTVWRDTGSTMYHRMTCGNTPISAWQSWLSQPSPVSTVPNTGRSLFDSSDRGLDEQMSRKYVACSYSLC